ncbi:hypothetical protein H311_02687, partial [Anncaliia algerae PRA109]
MVKKIKNHKNQISLIKPKSSQILESNPLRRTILTILMILLFMYIIVSDKMYLFVLIFLVQSFVFKEVIGVAAFRRKVSFLTKYLSFHFFFAANLFLLHKNITSFLRKFLPEITRFYTFFAFSFYVLGFCLFTFNLKRKRIRDQFIIFAVTHVTVFYLSKAVQLA